MDDLMHEVPRDLFNEWHDFWSLEPRGWRLAQLAATRVTWAVFQAQSEKPVREAMLQLRTAADDVQTVETEKCRFEANAIKSEIQDMVQRHARGEPVPPEYEELFKVSDPP